MPIGFLESWEHENSGRYVQVRGFYGACGECWHGKIMHEHLNRTRPCEACECERFIPCWETMAKCGLCSSPARVAVITDMTERLLCCRSHGVMVAGMTAPSRTVVRKLHEPDRVKRARHYEQLVRMGK